MAIEALTYDRLQAHLSEVSNEAMKNWTPRRVLDELLKVDPYADQSSTIFAGIEEEYGVPSEDMKLLGSDAMFTVKWANSAHNSLGNFLHVPTLAQLEATKEISNDKIRNKANAIVNKLDDVLSSPIFNVNFGNFYSFECDCGFVIRRRIELLKGSEGIVCGSCGAIFDAQGNEGGEVTFRLRRVEYECSKCKSRQLLPSHRIKDGLAIECGKCGNKHEVRTCYCLTPLDERA